jgi:hypothetical protein
MSWSTEPSVQMQTNFGQNQSNKFVSNFYLMVPQQQLVYGMKISEQLHATPALPIGRMSLVENNFNTLKVIYTPGVQSTCKLQYPVYFCVRILNIFSAYTLLKLTVCMVLAPLCWTKGMSNIKKI